ncbi:hypothetical protein J8TS2_15270 [Lederbergia ruris]|uniref:Uncharacterized protein n=1 Tax=Lederbergia ruris TaxID=217495 RepID=A0ABQ4KIN4_9BACI|nr:hypothetical protein J8TS2_15270 [Lederbergia ruris]
MWPSPYRLKKGERGTARCVAVPVLIEKEKKGDGVEYGRPRID